MTIDNDVESIRKAGTGEARIIGLMEGLADLLIDIRSGILCCLSAEDGEWAGGQEIVSQARNYEMLMEMMLHYAESCVSDGAESLVWKILSLAANKAGQPILLPWAGEDRG